MLRGTWRGQTRSGPASFGTASFGAASGPERADTSGRRMRCAEWPCQTRCNAGMSGPESAAIAGLVVVRIVAGGTAVVICPRQAGVARSWKTRTPDYQKRRLVSRMPADCAAPARGKRAHGRRFGAVPPVITAKSEPGSLGRRRGETRIIRPIGSWGAASPQAP